MHAIHTPSLSTRVTGGSAIHMSPSRTPSKRPSLGEARCSRGTARTWGPLRQKPQAFPPPSGASRVPAGPAPAWRTLPPRYPPAMREHQELSHVRGRRGPPRRPPLEGSEEAASKAPGRGRARGRIRH
ncbi:uncharacterized protein RHO17_005253 [Thomomys bottae]